MEPYSVRPVYGHAISGGTRFVCWHHAGIALRSAGRGHQDVESPWNTVFRDDRHARVDCLVVSEGLIAQEKSLFVLWNFRRNAGNIGHHFGITRLKSVQTGVDRASRWRLRSGDAGSDRFSLGSHGARLR